MTLNPRPVRNVILLAALAAAGLAAARLSSTVLHSQTASPAPQQTQPPAPVVRIPPTSAGTAAPAPRATHPAPKPAAPAAHAGAIEPANPPTSDSKSSDLSPFHPKPPALSLLPPAPFDRTVVVIDPAHGGTDNGSRLTDDLVEKQVTLALAFRLRSLLTARGFDVVMTRDSDAASEPNPPFGPLTLDDRAGIANHQRPVACLLLHATAAGQGVHLYSSELAPTPGEVLAGPWLTAQAPWVPQSRLLEKQLGDALDRAHVNLVSGAASVRPLDSLTCPALVVELAPSGDDTDSINDQDYQQRVAAALANALVAWQNTAQAPPRAVPASTPEAQP